MKALLTCLLCVLLVPVCRAQYIIEDYITKKASLIGPAAIHNGVTEVSLVGKGDIQLGFSEGDLKKVPVNTGVGVLFWRIWPNSPWEMQLDAQINIASTVDSAVARDRNGVIQDNRLYGRYVLQPGATGQSGMVRMLFYKDAALVKGKSFPLNFVSGYEFMGSATNQIWASYRQDSLTGLRQPTSRAINVTLLAVRAGVFYEVVPEDDRRGEGFSIRLGLNAIARGVQGDIGRQVMKPRREYYMGHHKKAYLGVEGLLAVRLKNLRAEASLPILFSGKAVAGLTGIQFVPTISFVGGFTQKLGR